MIPMMKKAETLILIIVIFIFKFKIFFYSIYITFLMTGVQTQTSDKTSCSTCKCGLSSTDKCYVLCVPKKCVHMTLGLGGLSGLGYSFYYLYKTYYEN